MGLEALGELIEPLPINIRLLNGQLADHVHCCRLIEWIEARARAWVNGFNSISDLWLFSVEIPTPAEFHGGEIVRHETFP